MRYKNQGWNEWIDTKSFFSLEELELIRDMMDYKLNQIGGMHCEMELLEKIKDIIKDLKTY